MNKDTPQIQTLIKSAVLPSNVLNKPGHTELDCIVNNLYKIDRATRPSWISNNLHVTYGYKKNLVVDSFIHELIALEVLKRSDSHEELYLLTEEFRNEVDYSLLPLLEISIKIKGMEINGSALREVVRFGRRHLASKIQFPDITTSFSIRDRGFDGSQLEDIIKYVEDKEIFFDKKNSITSIESISAVNDGGYLRDLVESAISPDAYISFSSSLEEKVMHCLHKYNCFLSADNIHYRLVEGMGTWTMNSHTVLDIVATTRCLEERGYLVSKMTGFHHQFAFSDSFKKLIEDVKNY